jgi:ubiquinone/menaquinone biosynthesis C-methylase UbiE
MEAESEFKMADASSYDDAAADFDLLTDRYSRTMARDLAQRVGAGRRKTVIDMGCGTGLVAFEVIAASGDATRVIGIDLSNGMLSAARARLAKEGPADRLSFASGDAEALDLPDGAADGYVSLHAFRHFPNPDKAALEAFRILEPGGRIVVAIGSRPRILTAKGVSRAVAALFRTLRERRGLEVCACFQIEKLVDEHLKSVPEVEVAGWSSGLSETSGVLRDILKNAGFVNLRHDWIGSDHVVDTIEEFWRLQTTISTHARKHLAAATPDEVETLKKAFWAESSAVLARGGRMTYRVGAAVVSGERPRA